MIINNKKVKLIIKQNRTTNNSKNKINRINNHTIYKNNLIKIIMTI